MTDLGRKGRAPSGAAERFLCCALAWDRDWHRRELAALLETAGEENAWAFACAHDAEGIAGSALRHAVGEDATPARWTEAADRTEWRIRAYMAELDRVAAELARHGIALVALKNAGIARGIMVDWAECPMGDVDTLVDRSDFEQAHSIMLGLGYAVASRRPRRPPRLEETVAEGGVEYSRELKDGQPFWFELQWRTVSGRWLREDQEPLARDLIRRSAPCHGSSVRILSPTDNLLQVCLHTAKHSYVRAPGFRLHTDVDRIVRRGGVNWTLFVRDARRLEIATAVFFSLLFPLENLRTPVPFEAMEALEPLPWRKRLLRLSIERAGLYWPHEKKWSRLGYVIVNAMLYDTLRGFIRALFPSRDWIRRRYGVRRRRPVLWWYAVHLFDLAFRRART